MVHYHFAGFSDPVCSLTHFAGALVCVPSSLRLLQKEAENSLHRKALLVYCLSCILLLTMSGFYHLLPFGESRELFKRLDHAAIFVLIAGTFTPIHVILFEGFWRWGPLLLVWLVAILGIVIKMIFFAEIPEPVSISIYLGMGWLGFATGGLAWAQRGFQFILPLLGGSLIYSTGTAFEFLNEPILIDGVLGPHELFHIAVLFGIAAHWRFIRSLLVSREHHESELLFGV